MLFREPMVISNRFSERTQANLEVALERACQPLGELGMTHECRRFVARKMIVAASRGITTLAELADVGRLASKQLLEGHARSPRSHVARSSKR